MRTLALFGVLVMAALQACTTVRHEEQPAAQMSAAEAGASRREAPLFEGLGNLHHPITTKSKAAQQYFDQGLRLCYAFNHPEAVRSFQAATKRDPNCAMCYWGIAFALGSNINAPMPPENVKAAWDAVSKARELAGKASAREQAYIAALATRYQAEPPSDRLPLDRAYADAMRGVARAYPDDLDAQALFAEAVMDTMPWNYYLENGAPKPETVEAVAALESVLSREPNHIGAIHFYIHAVEASSTPERAEAPADRLGALTPMAGHLVHMPSHIYYRVGRYNDAVIVNEKAATADESYISQCRAQGFYPALYYPHNLHFLYAAASAEGRSTEAIDAAKRLMDAAPEKSFREYPMLEEFRPVYLFALARFGRWDDVLAQPAPPPDLIYATAMWRYARGMALAANGKPKDARIEQDALREIAAAPAFADLKLLSGSQARDLLAIASQVLGAEIARVEKRRKDEIAQLREAVRLQDALPYTEPPPWYFPVRQALGAALLRAHQAGEAEQVFRDDLAHNPRNGWSLYGLATSLEAQGKEAEAASVRNDFEAAWVRADVSPSILYR